VDNAKAVVLFTYRRANVTSLADDVVGPVDQADVYSCKQWLKLRHFSH